jgi:hypothetical protein
VQPSELQRLEKWGRRVAVRVDVQRRNGRVVEKYVWEVGKGMLVRVKGGRKTKGRKR